jgi:sugar phosphate isomerase/epimerase
MTDATAAFACNTYSYIFSEDAERCIAHLSALGFAGFELMMYPGHLWPAETDAGTRRALRQAVEANGQRIISLNMPNIDINVAGGTAEMRRYSLGILTDIVRLAGDLGVPGVVIGPGKANPLFPAPREVLVGHFHAALDELAPLAASAGTTLLVENMSFAFLPKIDELLLAVDAYGRDDIGIVFDVANSHFVGEALGPALLRCRPRLKLVHLSDTDRNIYRHAAIGEGTVPFEELPAALAAVAYDGPLVLEIIADDPDRAIQDGAVRLAALGIGRAPA